ncbi:hypothetical protein DFJ73DRAFT_793196 [Zopfochytrium polystomum]|nr:hypothetical protein DFJ73DRAFT_793196 [Zopfochytrium polystomum]
MMMAEQQPQQLEHPHNHPNPQHNPHHHLDHHDDDQQQQLPGQEQQEIAPLQSRGVGDRLEGGGGDDGLFGGDGGFAMNNTSGSIVGAAAAAASRASIFASGEGAGDEVSNTLLSAALNDALASTSTTTTTSSSSSSSSSSYSLYSADGSELDATGAGGLDTDDSQREQQLFPIRLHQTRSLQQLPLTPQQQQQQQQQQLRRLRRSFRSLPPPPNTAHSSSSNVSLPTSPPLAPHPASSSSLAPSPAAPPSLSSSLSSSEVMLSPQLTPSRFSVGLSPAVAASLSHPASRRTSFSPFAMGGVTVESDSREDLIRSIPIFRSVAFMPESSAFYKEVARVVQLRHYVPGDVIINEGDVAKSIFFVIRGQVEVLSSGGDFAAAELDAGSYFGEIAAIFETPRIASVRAITKCVIAAVPGTDLKPILQNYPLILNVIKSESSERISESSIEKFGLSSRTSSGLSSRRSTAGSTPRASSIDDIAVEEDVEEESEVSPKVPTLSPARQDSNMSNEEKDVLDDDSDDSDDSEDEEDVDMDSSPIADSSLLTKRTSMGNPASYVNRLAAKHTVRRRASVAVWADEKLSALAQSLAAKEFLPGTGFGGRFTSGSSAADAYESDDSDDDEMADEFATVDGAAGAGLSADMIPSALGGLPQGIAGRVLQYLDFRQLMRIRSAGREMVALLLEPALGLVKRVDLSPWHKKIDDTILTHVVSFCGANVEELCLRSCWQLTDKALDAIASNCVVLRSLNLSSVWDISDAGVANLCNGLVNGLEEIDLSNCRKLTDAAMLSLLNSSRGGSGHGTGLGGLSAVQMSFCKNFSDLSLNHPAWTLVESLNMHRCTGITDEGFASWELAATGKRPGMDEEEVEEAVATERPSDPPIVVSDAALAPNGTDDMDVEPVGKPSPVADETEEQSKMSTTEEESGTDCMSTKEENLVPADSSADPVTTAPTVVFTDTNAEDIPILELPPSSNVPVAQPTLTPFALHELILSDCSFLTDAAITSIALSCPHLTVLSLSFCCALTEAFAAPLSAHCPRIRGLDVSYCGAAVTNASLSTLATGLQDLERLSLRGCVQITTEGVVASLGPLTALRMVNLSQCRNVKAAGVSAGVDGRWELVSTGNVLEGLLGMWRWGRGFQGGGAGGVGPGVAGGGGGGDGRLKPGFLSSSAASSHQRSVTA